MHINQVVTLPLDKLRVTIQDFLRSSRSLKKQNRKLAKGMKQILTCFHLNIRK